MIKKTNKPKQNTRPTLPGLVTRELPQTDDSFTESGDKFLWSPLSLLSAHFSLLLRCLWGSAACL